MRIVVRHLKRRLWSLRNRVLFGWVLRSEGMDLVIFCFLFLLSWSFPIQIKLETRLSCVRLLVLGLMWSSVMCSCSVLCVGFFRIRLVHLLLFVLLGLWDSVLIQNFCLILSDFLFLVAVDLLWASRGGLLVLVCFLQLFLHFYTVSLYL